MNDCDIITELRSELRATLVPYDPARANEMIGRALGAVDNAELHDIQAAAVQTGIQSTNHEVRRNWFSRYALPAVAAASVIAVAAVSAVVVSSSHGGPTRRPAVASAAGPAHAAPTPAQPPFGLAWRFSVHPVAGYDIKRLEITNVAQSADVTAHGQPKSSGAITLYAPGALNPAEQPSGTPITVQGRTGVFGMLGGKPALAWQYANDAWAVVTGDWGAEPDPGHYDLAAARAAQQIIADAVDTSASEPFLIDFRLGWLPAGLVYEQGVDAFGPNDTPLVMLGFGDGKSGTEQPKDKPTYGGSTLTITRQAASHQNPPNMTVGGRPAFYDDLGLTVNLADGTDLYLGLTDRGAVSKDVLVKIATNASVAPKPADRSTWVPASASMPR
ncbi:MAG: hypothetical protein ABI808_09665 [Pseudonocardiales bacterium]